MTREIGKLKYHIRKLISRVETPLIVCDQSHGDMKSKLFQENTKMVELATNQHGF